MNLLLEGIQIGLVLAIMTGPIFFALLHVSVEEGLAAGAMVGLGIWISDILFILGVSLGMNYAMTTAETNSFTFGVGVIGGLILIAFGVGTVLKKPRHLIFEVNEPNRYSSWLSLWTKGFLINSINPFTFFFWLGIASTMVVKNALTLSETILFFSGIMITVIATDFLKIYLSKEIRQFLQYKHLLWLRYLSGGALVLFGLALIVRVVFL